MSGTAVEMKRSPKGSFLIFDSSSSRSPSVMLCSLNPLLSETMTSVHLSIPLAQLQMKNTKIRSAGKFPPETFDPERKYRSGRIAFFTDAVVGPSDCTEEPSTSNEVQFELQKLVDVYPAVSGIAVEMKRSPKGSFLIFDSSSSPSPSVKLCSLNPLLSETMDSVHLSTPLAQLQMKNTKIRSAGKFTPETFYPERRNRSGKVLLMLGKVQFELQNLVDVYLSHAFKTITIPSNSLLNELQTVEISFLKRALKALEDVEPHVKSVTESRFINYHFDGLDDSNTNYDTNDDGEMAKWRNEFTARSK
ncbi:Uncharacterized protein At2g33490 [Linum perenne]